MFTMNEMKSNLFKMAAAAKLSAGSTDVLLQTEILAWMDHAEAF